MKQIEFEYSNDLLIRDMLTQKECTCMADIAQVFISCGDDIQRSLTLHSPEQSFNAVNRTVVSHMNAMEHLDRILQNPRLTDGQRDIFYRDHAPQWLATPLDIEQDLLPTAQQYGIAESADELRSLCRVSETTKTVMLFSYLQVVRDRIQKDHAHLGGYELERMLLDPTITPQEHALIGIFLLHASYADPTSRKEFQAALAVPLLLTENRLLRKEALSPLPRVCGTGLSYGEKRKAAISAMQLEAIVCAFSNDMWRILGNPDDTRHDITRRVFDVYDQISEHSLRELLFSRAFMDEISNHQPVVERIKLLLQTAEDLEDSWYKGLADGLLNKAKEKFPYRTYFMQELQDRFSLVPAMPEEAQVTPDMHKEHTAGCETRFREASTRSSDDRYYEHEVSNVLLREWGLDPDTTMIKISNVIHPPGNIQSLWAVKLIQKIAGKDEFTEASYLIVLDPSGLFLWSDMVDRQIDPGGTFEQHGIYILKRGIDDALTYGSGQHSPADVTTHENHLIILPSLGQKGPARIEPKDTKRKHNNYIKHDVPSNTEEINKPTGQTRMHIHADAQILKGSGNPSVCRRAMERYRLGLRHMKQILVDIRGPSGGRVFELRAGHMYRMMFERTDDTHAVLLDIILRKDLETWISNHQ